MIKTLSLSAAFLLALSAPAHALTAVKPANSLAISDTKNDVSPLLKGETLVRYENEPSFSMTDERKDMIIEYRAPIKDRVSVGFSMSYSYDANANNNVERAPDSAAMVHFRLKF
jgi:hypothetical protein